MPTFTKLLAFTFGALLTLSAQTFPTPSSPYQDLYGLNDPNISNPDAYVPPATQPCTGVPATYTSLCNELLTTDLEPFEAQYLAHLVLPNPITTLYGGQINPSESAVGPGLLTANNESAVYQWLCMQKALGAKEVTVHVDFPILDPNFYWSTSQTPSQQAAGQAQLAQMQAYYTNVAKWASQFGFTLIVQTQNLFPAATTLPSAPITLWGGANAVATLANFYNGEYQANDASPNYAAYSADRGIQAAWIAANMKPAYLSVIYEPDSEAANALLPNLGTVPGSLANLQGIIAGYNSMNPPATKVGAGVGVWITYYDPIANKNYQAIDFDQAYASTPGTIDGANPLALNFIDMHLYDITNSAPNNFLAMAWTVAQWVHTTPKLGLGMSEFWLAKASADEVTDGEGLPTYRNTYSFWMPLDSRFLSDMHTFTAYWGFNFETISYPQFFSANLKYANAPPNDIVTWDTEVPPNAASINSADLTATTAALNVGAFTNTGGAYYKTLVPTDIMAPSAPPNLKASANVGIVYLTWNASTDNVGVLYYVITRNGLPAQKKPVHDTQWYFPGGVSELFYQESGLNNNTMYTYTVYAIDMAGNTSLPSVASVTTPN